MKSDVINYKSTLLLCYLSYAVQSITNNFAPVLFVIFQNDFGISFEKIGRLILINFATQICADYVSVHIVDKIGYRKTTIFAHFCAMVGFIMLSFVPRLMPDPYIGIVICTVVFAAGGGIIEVVISPIVEAMPIEEKASAMSLLHSFYCWGQLVVVLVTTLLLKIFGYGNWMYISLLWAVVPGIGFFGFFKAPIAPMVNKDDRIDIKSLFSSKFFLAALVMMTCAGATEITLAQWASLFAEKGLGLPKVLGDVFGPCLFALLMASGRVAYGIFGSKVNLNKALIVCSMGCVTTYLLTALVPNPLVSLLSCAATGIFASLMWPGVLSLSAERFPTGGALMFGCLAFFGDAGCSLGPWISGLVSDAVSVSDVAGAEQFGLRMGVLSTVIFPLMLLVITVVIRKKRSH